MLLTRVTGLKSMFLLYRKFGKKLSVATMAVLQEWVGGGVTVIWDQTDK